MNAIIIGASSGIGNEVARLLLQRGWHCGIAARRTEPLEQLRSEYPQLTETETIDITSEEAPERLLQLIERLGGMDLYFHASGIGKQNRDLQTDIEMRTVDTNAMGFTRMVDTAFNYLASHGGGHIAAISSIAGTNRFTDLRPGFVDTPLLDGDNHFPMMLRPQQVAKEMVEAIERRRHVRVIDWRWRIITALWRLIPRCIWRKLSL